MANQFQVRSLSAADLPHRVEWFSHPSVMSQMSMPPITLEGTLRWFEGLHLRTNRMDVSAVDPQSGELLAMGGITDMHPVDSNGELYIVVKPGLTGRGIGTPCVQWLCNWAFSEGGLAKVYLYTRQNNPRARKLYEKLGFIPEGILRQHIVVQKQREDRHIHGLLNTEWRAQPWALPVALRKND